MCGTEVPALLTSSGQLLLVVAAGWDESAARLQCFEREPAGVAWRPAGGPTAVTIGRAGLAWGQGLKAAVADAGRDKREGDGRAPAGVFPVTALFGAAGPPPEARLPWLQATADLKCIDDPASRHYNRIVDRTRIDRIDWSSCEDMLRGDSRYELGAVIGCNCDPVVPGAGSCIFLHVWVAPGMPTAGCTAMALADMKCVAGWLDGARSPLLVQLPRDAYERLHGPWALPDFPA